jgi:enterochelin esterase-like enzyme
MQIENIVEVLLEPYELPSAHLERSVKIDIYSNSSAQFNEKVQLLLVNDGQDLRTINFKEIFEKTEMEQELVPLIIAAVHCGEDRINEYGTSCMPDFKGRGSKAPLYERFVLEELIPFIKGKFSLKQFSSISIAGFSLGGLSAIDLAWNHPETFSKVGIFSASLWWRSRDHVDKAYNPWTDRIMHAQVRNGKYIKGMKFFLQCGELDEAEDRNRNGVIDSIDDTIDLMRELLSKGYREGEDMMYFQMPDGKHDVASWGRAWPVFLGAFFRKS